MQQEGTFAWKVHIFERKWDILRTTEAKYDLKTASRYFCKHMRFFVSVAELLISIFVVFKCFDEC